ncbi:MAG TPA: glycosyltransferase 87 family protein [Candidatus Woesebacteria bacterium]|nr:glycosyltransferase 87 family protein [Candidatus Woesebacteria bacterium]
MKKRIKELFVFALILRLILAPLFYHPDIKSQNFHFQFLSLGKINIYQYIDENKQFLPYRDTFNYLPLTYLSFGAGQILLRPLLPSNFFTWLNDWGPSQNNYPDLLYFMLILKLPYIIFDLGIGYLLYKLYDKKVLIIWLFNPLSFYLIYILANFDIVPVFFSLLSFYLLKKSRNSLAFIFLGIATALKFYPLLFFPFFLFYHPNNIQKIIRNIFAFLLPLIITIIPFVFTPFFVQAFSGSGLTQKITEFKILNIPIYPVIYMIILAIYYFSKNKNIEKSFLWLFLGFIVLVNYHPQWLLWFLPFIIFPILKTKIKTIIFVLIVFLSLLYIVLINDQFLFWGHLIPIDINYLYISSPYQIVTQRFHQSPELIQQQLKLMTAFLSLIFIYPFREKNT